MTTINTQEPILTIKNLYAGYGQVQVLKDINFSLYAGEIVAYIGANGAGKSTTIKSILGITDYTGDIIIEGEIISKDKPAYKAKIGYVPEITNFYENLTAEEFLNFTGQMFDLDEHLLEQRIKTMTAVFGIDNKLSSPINSYSKGMKQKLLIIASMLHNPDILIFDEPINGMDANSVAIFKTIMLELIKRNKAILYCSHLMDIVEKISSRIVLIDKGQIIADDSFANLAESEHSQTLENLFNKMTGFDATEEKARQFVNAICSEDENAENN